MQFKVTQAIENEVWKLTFVNVAEEISEADKKLMVKFGEPQVDVGGVYLPDGPYTFDLPNKYIRIRSDLPYTESFDAKAAPFDTDTQTKVLGFRDGLLTKFNTAMTALRAHTDTFTDQQLFTI